MPVAGPRTAFVVAVCLVTVSVVAGFILLELAVRTFGSDERRWQWSNFLEDAAVTKGRWRIFRPDPELGYSPQPGYSGTDHAGGAMLSFDDDGLRSNGSNEGVSATNKGVFLVVGNSYAMGEEVADHETFPAHLEELLDRPVLNGGVVGYGLDQAVLRAEKLVRTFRPNTLIVSFIADDVRRTEMEVLWGNEKPYFEVQDGSLLLRNVPVPPPTAAMQRLDPVRRVLGYSFLVDVTMRRLGVDWWVRGRPMHSVRAHSDGTRVSCLLMERLGRLRDIHQMNVLVVAKYTPLAWQDIPTLHFEAEILATVLACAEESGLATLDTRREVADAVRREGIERYYIGGHNNDAGNRLLAELTANSIRAVEAMR